MKQLLKKAKQIAILILAISFIGCSNDDVELPEVIAGFTYTLNIDTGTVSFINISENSRTYSWDFGDDTNSVEINPIKTYGNGSYMVILKATNVAGASDIFESEITISIPEIATLPISFDGENTSYDAETFGGTSFEVVDNPDPSGSNSSASMVGAVTNIGAQYEGFYFDLGSPIDLSTLSSISMNFWADSPVDVLMKLEEGTEGPIEVTASHGGTGWEVIYFTFDSTASYSKLTLFVDGPGTTAGTFYLDDIMQINTADIPCPETDLELPIDFDCNGIAYATKIVGNVSFEVVDNPELSGINSEASKVGKITNIGANWENAFFNLDTAIDLSTDQGIKLKLYSDQALPIKLKLEDGTEDPVEADVNHTGSGWEELTFTLLSTASYNDMIIFVDGPGTAAGTFYVDDIEQVAGDLGDPCEAETAQSLAGADFNLTFMTDPSASIISDGAGFEWVDNPDFDNDVNKSCKVGKITKAGNNPWDNNQINLDAKLDFNANEGLKIKVWSALANTEVRIKLEENGNAGNNVEQFLTTSVTSEWEELTFPFTSADSDKFDKIVIFFDLNAGNTDTYYFDDLALYGTGSGGGACTETMLFLPIDFDCEGIDYESKRVPGDIGFSIIDNPQQNGANPEATKVGEIVNIGNNWENLNFTLDTPISFATDKSIKLKLYSTVNVDIKLKVETGGAPVENDQTHGGTGWEELTFTLATSESFSNIVVFIDGPGTTVGTFYIDDIEQVASGGGGGTFSLTETIDFEADGFGSGWAWNVFENEDNPPLEFIANPVSGGINTSATVAKITARQAGAPWVGTETAHGQMGITWDLSASNAIIKIMVYKTVISDVGIKLVDPAGGAQGEIKVANTLINQWEELTFDFSGNIGLGNTTNLDQIVVFPDFRDPRTEETITYFDNITFNSN